jgi:hypothetical protein
MAFRVADRGRERREDQRGDRREDRREERRAPPPQQYRPQYRPPAYAPAPRAYAYPAPAYPYGERAAPPPPAYRYAPPPPGRNSLGANWGQQQDDARRGVRQGNVPLGQVMANIRRRTPGKILDAGIEPGPDGRPAYRVRWAAKGGRRIDFIVDAQTGAIIGQSGY